MSSPATETNENAFWSVDSQLYNELQLSDSDQSEIDFEIPIKTLSFEDKSGYNGGIANGGRNKIKYITVKSGNIVKKIRLNWKGFSGPYIEKVKQKGNYRKILRMIRQAIEKGEEPPTVITPDESDLQGMTEEEKEKQREIWRQELAKIEEEIQTLKHVLQSKTRDSQDLKRKLGISVWRELTDDLSQGVRNVKESNVYQNVEGTISQLGKVVTEAPIYQNVEGKISQLGKAVAEAPIYQKTESVVKATAEGTRSLLGGLTGGFTQKIGQLKNSDSFRSLEERVGSAYENVKTKVSASRSSSMQSFDEALREETARRAANAASPTSPSIPENKALS